MGFEYKFQFTGDAEHEAVPSQEKVVEERPEAAKDESPAASPEMDEEQLETPEALAENENEEAERSNELIEQRHENLRAVLRGQPLDIGRLYRICGDRDHGRLDELIPREGLDRIAQGLRAIDDFSTTGTGLDELLLAVQQIRSGAEEIEYHSYPQDRISDDTESITELLRAVYGFEQECIELSQKIGRVELPEGSEDAAILSEITSTLMRAADSLGSGVRKISHRRGLVEEYSGGRY